jgi:hypothetical protein
MYRIRITMASRIRIRIRAKSWITDPHQSLNSGAVEAQNGAIKGCGRSQLRPVSAKWSRGGFLDQWSQIRVTLMTIDQDLDLHP